MCVCMYECCVFSLSPLTTLAAHKCNILCFFFFSYVCQCASVCLCVCVSVSVVILRLCCCCSLMTRAVPGSRGCHSVVTNSLGRLAAAKTSAPAKPTPPPPPLPVRTHTQAHPYIQTHTTVTPRCLDSSKCVYVAVDGCLKTLL